MPPSQPEAAARSKTPPLKAATKALLAKVETHKDHFDTESEREAAIWGWVALLPSLHGVLLHKMPIRATVALAGTFPPSHVSIWCAKLSDSHCAHVHVHGAAQQPTMYPWLSLHAIYISHSMSTTVPLG
jgi:hypothetical protein